MEDLKRPQERQFDEFSRQRSRESQSTIDELTPHISELQERANFYE